MNVYTYCSALSDSYVLSPSLSAYPLFSQTHKFMHGNGYNERKLSYFREKKRAAQQQQLFLPNSGLSSKWSERYLSYNPSYQIELTLN